jgi:hypothetical protein
MVETLQNKLKRLVNWLRRVFGVVTAKLLVLYKVIKTWCLNTIVNTLPHFGNRLVKLWRQKIVPLPHRVLCIFAENIYGIWLPKKWSSLLWYLVLLVSSLIAIILADSFDYTRKFTHTVNGNEAIIGVFTVLLALLIPIAIALIEDARESALARQTIVRRIIRLQYAPIVLLFICFFLFIPLGLFVGGESLTVRSLYVSVLVCCAWFVLDNLYRSYRWLSDGSEYSDGVSKDGEPPTDPQTGAFFSYKFSVLVQELNNIKGYQTWTAIWSRWFPVGYEDALHGSFFERLFETLNKRKIKKYLSISLELEAYAGSLNKRNIRSVQYEYVYPEKFLSVYTKIHRILDNRETDSKIRIASSIAGLWRGERAIETIVNKVIDNMLTNELIWHLFKAMGEYAKENDLTSSNKGKRLREDSQINAFLKKYFDAIVDDKISTYQADSYFTTSSYWAATYTNLYVHRYNISFLVADTFKEWLFNRLKNNRPKDQLFRADSVVSDVFPEVDPITFGALMWFFYKSQNTTESDTIVKLMYKEGRPIGMIGRIMTGTWSGSEDEDRSAASSKTYANFNNQLEIDTIKLFATMYRSYLTQFWNLDEIIETVDSTDRNKLDKRESERLDDFRRHIELIRDFYKKEAKDAQRKPKAN